MRGILFMLGGFIFGLTLSNTARISSVKSDMQALERKVEMIAQEMGPTP